MDPDQLLNRRMPEASTPSRRSQNAASGRTEDRLVAYPVVQVVRQLFRHLVGEHDDSPAAAGLRWAPYETAADLTYAGHDLNAACGQVSLCRYECWSEAGRRPAVGLQGVRGTPAASITNRRPSRFRPHIGMRVISEGGDWSGPVIRGTTDPPVRSISTNAASARPHGPI